MITPKIFIGPMSLNVVDSIIEYCNEHNMRIGLIPSRRQVEYNGGYVNNWTTKKFSKYVRSRTNKVLLVRDHGGPGQGYIDDNGFESLKEDCKYLDIIHIDPWKKYPKYEEGLKWTIDMIKFCYNQNPRIEYEVGTEESIRKFDAHTLDRLILDLQVHLGRPIYNQIKYLVIQSGTSLEGNDNTGKYDKDRLISMIEVAKSYDLLSKEHNGDYLPKNLVNEKFSLGLDSINIAPEFGQIETKVILEKIKKRAPDLVNKFYEICFKSNRWIKWVPDNYNPHENKEKIINISGHYVFSTPEFILLKNNIIITNREIKEKIKNKINRYEILH